ncbi:hypothetical protein BJ165DRAFT_1468693 [Panaeolus papilionaceus]|nr:hypothetical protein BJ165DRAFT_1468693 [Panaeolus papilionaceus]
MHHNTELRIRVANLEDAIVLYKAALEPLGLHPVLTRPDGLAVGFGRKRLCKARIFIWLIAPGAPLTIDPLAQSPAGVAKADDTSPLLDTQSFNMLEKGDNDADEGVTKNIHICLPTRRRANVDHFYESAIAAGAKGVLQAARRPSLYNGRWYYNAIIQDSEGRSIEVACRSSPLVSGKYGWVTKMVIFVLICYHMFTFYMRRM